MWASDRQRVEVLLPAQMVLAIIIAGAGDRDADFDACKALLLTACKEPVADLTPAHQRKVLNRATRLHREVSAPYTKDGAEVSKLGLIVFYWLKAVVDSGYLVFAAGSAIDRAIDLFVPAIEHAAQVEAVDRSAQKQAVHMLRHLQRLGYYQGIGINADAA